MSIKPYTPVPAHVNERLEIAILTGETMNLHWADEASDQAFMSRCKPLALLERDGRDYLEAQNEQGDTVVMRLDLIRNFPMPVK